MPHGKADYKVLVFHRAGTAKREGQQWAAPAKLNNCSISMCLF